MNNIFHLHIKRKRSDHTNDLERFLFKYGACEWAVRVRWSEKPEVLVQLQKAPQKHISEWSEWLRHQSAKLIYAGSSPVSESNAPLA